MCTGNICRSPAAERLLAAGLGEGVDVSSAGTYGLVDQPVAAPMRALLTGVGVSSDGFAARRLTGELVRRADLVLAMTREHRGDVVELWPGAVRRSFTLKELARLVDGLEPTSVPAGPPAQRLRALVELAGTRRRQVKDGRDDDVVDPYRRDDAVYAATFGTIESAVRRIVAYAHPSG